MILGRQIGEFGEAAALKALEHYPRIAFIHIPKCAGTSVSESLHAIYPMPLRAARFCCKFNIRRSKLAESLIDIRAMMFRQAVLINALGDPFVRFVTGHVYADPRVVEHFCDWKFVTVLREPRARFISGFLFGQDRQARTFGDRGCHLSDFLDTDRARCMGSVMTQHLSGRRAPEVEADPDGAIEAALDNLERFYSVAFIDDLDSWARAFSRAIGHNIWLRRLNPSPKPQAYAEIERSPALRERVDALCATDRQFYEAARLRFWDKATNGCGESRRPDSSSGHRASAPAELDRPLRSPTSENSLKV